MAKAQESFSFVIALSAALFIFLLANLVISANNEAGLRARAAFTAGSIISGLGRAIDFVYLNGNGTQFNYSLPQESFFNYTFYINSRYAAIEYLDNSIQTIKLATSNTQSFNASYGDYNIKNQGGMIIVTQI